MHTAYPEARVQFVEQGKPLPQCCAHCFYWMPIDGISSGDCNRYAPPQVPATEATHVCGDFKRYYRQAEWDAIKQKLGLQ